MSGLVHFYQFVLRRNLHGICLMQKVQTLMGFAAFHPVFHFLQLSCLRNSLGIKHGFPCINVCQVPRELLKTEALKLENNV